MKNNELSPLPRGEQLAEGGGRNSDLELPSYFTVRRTSTESDAVSPMVGTSRIASQQKSPNTSSHISGASTSHGPRTGASSISSAQSMISKSRAINDWNDKSICMRLATSTSIACNSSHHSVDPPRAAREGCEWVWFPEGYWAEREFRPARKSGPVSRQKWWNRSPERKSKSSAGTEVSEATTPLANLPTIKIGSLISGKSSPAVTPNHGPSATTSRSDSVAQTQGIKNKSSIQAKRMVPAYYSIHPEEQLGLYCRTKKSLRSRFIPKKTAADDSSIIEDRLTSRTTMLLQGTSHILDRVHGERYQASAPPQPTENPQTPGSPSSRSTRRFGLAPWHRKSSHDSILSASSSVFKLLLGKPPSATPNSDYQYEATDGMAYTKVDLTSPDPVEPTFLPSEAKRVNTPPMFNGTPEVLPRGFFFDLNPQSKRSTSPASTVSNTAARNLSRGQSPSREWWETDIQHAKTGNKSARLLEMDATKSSHSPEPPPTPFQLNLPEHLPNSPLCPKNPKHQSGGTGICPFHGR